MIIYYTGTGNSRYVAEEIAKVTGDSVVDITKRIKNNDHSALILSQKDKGNLIISVPTYAWRIPRIVEEWLKNTPITGAERVWFLMTCGDTIGTAPLHNKKLVADLHAEYMGTRLIVMPENYIAMFKVPKDHTARKIIANSAQDISQAASDILEGKEFKEGALTFMDHIYSDFVNPIFYRFFVKAKAFTVDDKCIGCGKCERLCPLNNITLKEGRPVWGSSCTHCMACICKCPEKAIEYGNKSQGKPRYQNPYV